MNALTLGRALRDDRRLILGEVCVILGSTQLLLMASDALGGATLRGGFVGWLALALAVVLVWWSLRLRGLGWASIGLGRPRRWIWIVLLAPVVAVATMVVVNFMVARLVLPLVHNPPDSSRFDALRGNLLALVLGLFSVWTSAAFGEEILARGYLIGRLAGVLGGSRAAWVTGTVLSAVVFGAMHFYQGAAGMALTGLVGLIFGIVYLLLGRNLWVLVLAHGLIDTVSFVSIYAAR
jgi:membrane protease YdiL (CAAX protease family)